jgi:hypothetical protein
MPYKKLIKALGRIYIRLLKLDFAPVYSDSYKPKSYLEPM